LDSPEGARQATAWVLGVLAEKPVRDRYGYTVKFNMVLNSLAARWRLPQPSLLSQFRAVEQAKRRKPQPSTAAKPSAGESEPQPAPVRVRELDVLDRELVQVVLNEPAVIGEVVSRVALGSVRDAPLRTILGVCYDLHSEGVNPSFDRVVLRLED